MKKKTALMVSVTIIFFVHFSTKVLAQNTYNIKETNLLEWSQKNWIHDCFWIVDSVKLKLKKNNNIITGLICNCSKDSIYSNFCNEFVSLGVRNGILEGEFVVYKKSKITNKAHLSVKSNYRNGKPDYVIKLNEKDDTISYLQFDYDSNTCYWREWHQNMSLKTNVFFQISEIDSLIKKNNFQILYQGVTYDEKSNLTEFLEISDNQINYLSVASNGRNIYKINSSTNKWVVILEDKFKNEIIEISGTGENINLKEFATTRYPFEKKPISGINPKATTTYTDSHGNKTTGDVTYTKNGFLEDGVFITRNADGYIIKREVYSNGKLIP